VRLGLTPDQELFQANSRKFLDASVSPAQLREWASLPAGHPAEWWRQGAELGWTSPLVPESSGGGTVSGAPLADLALVAHEWGRHAAPGAFIATNVAAYCLGQRAGGHDAPGALPSLLSGEATAAWVRAGAGQLGEATLRVQTEGDHLVLDGVAEAVEGAADTDWLMVTWDEQVGLLRLTASEAGGPPPAGVTVSRREGIDLNRRWARVGFDRVHVPLLSGTEPVVPRLLDLALCLQQAESVGAMEVAFDMTMEWVTHRYSFGRPLGSYQEIKHRLADMRMWLDASAAITVAAIDAWDRDRPDASELAAAAKAYVGHHGPELVQDCVQIHGGIGVTFDHDLHLFLRRVAAGAPAYGTPAQHRRRLAGMVARRAAA
jgi:alkylation response protein AidB-like acyl-CoA dehydrogenase